jgi:hypothetical protein
MAASNSRAAEDQPTMSSSGDLALYELQRPTAEPFLRMFRLTNTALDFLISDITFGCAAEALKDCRYTQALGLLDDLGMLNSWGHRPEQRLTGASQHRFVHSLQRAGCNAGRIGSFEQPMTLG